MKKEAVSVLKPRNGKTSKSKVEKTRPKRAVKTLNVEPVNFDDTLKTSKNGKSENVDREHAVGKMAAARRSNDETRSRPKKKSKIRADEAIAPVKTESKIVKIQTEDKNAQADEIAAKSKKRKSKVTKRRSIENAGDLKLTKKHVLRSVEAVQMLSQKREKLKKSLLPTESHPLWLQVTCMKIPKTPRRCIRPYLPHPLAGASDDVALFVPDLEKGRRKDYEKTVDHWETVLREKGVDRVTQVIPINRVKTEYSQHEMRRKLAMSFDYFLADGRVCGHLTHLLGKTFFKRKSPPTPVKLGRDDLKGEINFALRKTCMEVHPYGNTHTMQVGAISTSAKQLAENVWAACKDLGKEYPGGWENIRSITLKTNTGPAVPIYMNLGSKNDVPVPVVKPKRPRAYETVKGELTTVPGGATVKLTPEGRIHVKRLKDYGDPEEEEDEEEDEEEEEEEEEVKEESEGDRDESVQD